MGNNHIIISNFLKLFKLFKLRFILKISLDVKLNTINLKKFVITHTYLILIEQFYS